MKFRGMETCLYTLSKIGIVSVPSAFKIVFGCGISNFLVSANPEKKFGLRFLSGKEKELQEQ